MKKKSSSAKKTAKAKKPAATVTITKTKRGFHVQHEIDPLTGKPWEEGERPAHHAPKSSKPKKITKVPPSARESKKDIIMALIGRKGGATLAEIMAKTNWMPHSVRGFVATANKTTPIKSERDAAGERRYALVGA